MLHTIFPTFGCFSTLFQERKLSDTEREQKRETETERDREREREIETQRERERERDRRRFSDLYFISIEFNALQPVYSNGSSWSGSIWIHLHTIYSIYSVVDPDNYTISDSLNKNASPYFVHLGR